MTPFYDDHDDDALAALMGDRDRDQLERADRDLVDDDDRPAPPPFYDGPLGQHPFHFLCGTAGVGKTFEVKAFARAQKPGSVALCATTGIAAINLGEGTTLNALLGYFDTASLRDSYVAGHVQARLRSLRRAGLRWICCDEVSMMNAEQLTIITRALTEINTPRDLAGVGEESSTSSDETPTGEEPPQVGLILVGDFGQLPPIPDKLPNGRNAATPYAFLSPEWSRYAEHVTKLTTVRRQDQQDFIKAIHAVRAGDLVNALRFFRDRLHPQMDQQFNGTTIVAKNESVDRVNQLRLDQLTTPAVSFTKRSWGKPRGEWKQIPEQMTLKETALVMILANRRVLDDPKDPSSGWYVYVNGDLGELVGVRQVVRGPIAMVRLQRTGAVVDVWQVTREHLIPLEVGRRKELTEVGEEAKIRDKSEIIGAVTYMPLRCAYASTVHKCQGLTLDRVQVDLRDHFFGSAGMMFVALSRARTAEGLRIVGSEQTFCARCVVNEKVEGWL